MRLVNNFNFCEGCSDLSCVVANNCLNHNNNVHDTEYRQLCRLHGETPDQSQPIPSMLPVIHREYDERSEQPAQIHDSGECI